MKSFFKGILIVLFIDLMVILPIVFIYFVFITSQKPTLLPVPQQQVLGISAHTIYPGIPQRLIIPIIQVNAHVQSLGVNQKGEMDVPSNSLDVGWFKLGPHPGEIGSAVIAGHFDAPNGQSAVFTNLHRLRIGDMVYVEDDNGQIITFVVTGKQLYDSGYAEDVFGQNQGSHLNLVTCTGVWDKNLAGFTKRLVIFTDMITL